MDFVGLSQRVFFLFLATLSVGVAALNWHMARLLNNFDVANSIGEGEGEGKRGRKAEGGRRVKHDL